MKNPCSRPKAVWNPHVPKTSRECQLGADSSCHRLRPRETLGSPLSLPPRLREVPQPEQHCGPERGIPAPGAPRHSPRLAPGHAPSSPDPALHPLVLPLPWGDWG